MATTQTTYSEALPIGTPGLIANSELANIISRLLESASCAFGMPVLRGALDNGCILGVQETYEAAGANGDNAPAGATITAAPTVSSGAKLGVYRIVCTLGGATTASKWLITDPDGLEVGIATGDTAFSGSGLAFTITDSGTDPVVGEEFIITVTATSGTNVGSFLGISVRDTTLGAEDDTFSVNDTIPVMTQGVIWVTAGATVTPDDTVYWNPSTSRYTKTATHLAIPGAKFETSGVNGGLVKLAIR